MQPDDVERLFGDPPPEELTLPKAPLVRVLSQLRFESLAVIDSPNRVEAFTDALSEFYPYLDKTAEINMIVGQGQVSSQTTPTPVWRLRSPDKQSVVSLSNGSLSLETTNYHDRSAFCDELVRLAAVFEETIHVPSYTRIGLRYTNRIADSVFIDELPRMVRDEVLGVSVVNLGKDVSLRHALAQAVFGISDEGGLLAQWGILPPGGTIDPTLTPEPSRSWIMDIDAFHEQQEIPPTEEDIRATVIALASRAYTFFRWAVTPDFLTYFGGDGVGS